MDLVFFCLWVLAGTVAFIKIFQLYIKGSNTQRGQAKFIVSMIHRQAGVEGIFSYCKTIEKEPITKVVRTALSSEGSLGDKILMDNMTEVLVGYQKSLEKGIWFLAIIGNLATFVGLIGTIGGLIKSFAAVQGQQNNPELLKEAIGVAMNSCLQGIAIAVPCLILYAVLKNRENVLTDDLNKGALEIFVALKKKEDQLV